MVTKSASSITLSGAVTTAAIATESGNDSKCSSNKLLSEFHDKVRQAIPANVYLLSSCSGGDGEQSAEAYNTDKFHLPNPAGKAGGACTSAFLNVLYNRSHDIRAGLLTWKDALLLMSQKLTSYHHQQPTLSSSRQFDNVSTYPLHIVPPGSGKRRALLIGINYTGQTGELRAAQNDAKNLCEYLVRAAGFDRSQILVLMDDHEHPQPTKANIIRALKQLTHYSQPGDVVFVGFSGHGGRLANANANADPKEDAYHSTLMPVDFAQAGQIVDYELLEDFCKPMKQGVHVTVLIDCCNSGGALDLPYSLSVSDTCMKIKHNFRFDRYIPPSRTKKLNCKEKRAQDENVGVGVEDEDIKGTTENPMVMPSQEEAAVHTVVVSSNKGPPNATATIVLSQPPSSPEEMAVLIQKAQEDMMKRLKIVMSNATSTTTSRNVSMCHGENNKAPARSVVTTSHAAANKTTTTATKKYGGKSGAPTSLTTPPTVNSDNTVLLKPLSSTKKKWDSGGGGGSELPARVKNSTSTSATASTKPIPNTKDVAASEATTNTVVKKYGRGSGVPSLTSSPTKNSDTAMKPFTSGTKRWGGGSGLSEGGGSTNSGTAFTTPIQAFGESGNVASIVSKSIGATTDKKTSLSPVTKKWEGESGKLGIVTTPSNSNSPPRGIAPNVNFVATKYSSSGSGLSATSAATSSRGTTKSAVSVGTTSPVTSNPIKTTSTNYANKLESGAASTSRSGVPRASTTPTVKKLGNTTRESVNTTSPRSTLAPLAPAQKYRVVGTTTFAPPKNETGVTTMPFFSSTPNGNLAGTVTKANTNGTSTTTSVEHTVASSGAPNIRNLKSMFETNSNVQHT